MYFGPAPKLMIRLSARFENTDSTMKILVGDTPKKMQYNY